jgi:hypothetical protein
MIVCWQTAKMKKCSVIDKNHSTNLFFAVQLQTSIYIKAIQGFLSIKWAKPICFFFAMNKNLNWH